jgi:PKD repeat protein
MEHALRDPAPRVEKDAGRRTRRPPDNPALLTRNFISDIMGQEKNINLRFQRLLFVLAFGGVLFWGSSGLAQNYVNISRSPGWQSDCPRITVDPAGNIHAVWAEIYTISGIYFLSGDAFYSKYDIVTQQWSAPLNLSNSGLVANSEGYLVGIDSDPSGNVYVVYVNNTKILLRILSGGNWGAAFEVGNNASTIDQVRVAVTPRGDIFTCWWEIGPGTVFSRAKIGGSWESVRQISPSGIRSKFADIAVGTNVAYSAFMAGTDVTYHIVVTSRVLTSGASWLSPVRATNSPDQEQQPAIAIDDSDVVHIVYTPDFDMQRIVRYVFGTTGGFSSPIDLTAKEGLHYPSMHARGNNLYACWQAAGGVGYSARGGGSWTAPAVLPNTANVLYLTDVATSPGQDKVYYVWEGGNGLGTEIFWSGPLPPPGIVTGSPVASFSLSPASGSLPLAVAFDASASHDTDGGTITSYSWNFGDGQTGSGRTVTHTFATAGTFTVLLTVKDNDGKMGSTTKTVTVIRSNLPPTADFSFSPATGLYPVDITFDASASRDPDGSITQYRWDFGDGQLGSGRVVSHSFRWWGTFGVKLTVTDNESASASKMKTLEILRLFQPLNIRCEVQSDESLFRVRHINEVKWERNPANDAAGFQVTAYRVYRKKSEEPDSAYQGLAEVASDAFSFMDRNLKEKKGATPPYYSYTVTSLDGKGHESPIQAASPGRPGPVDKGSPAVRKGRLINSPY